MVVRFGRTAQASEPDVAGARTAGALATELGLWGVIALGFAIPFAIALAWTSVRTRLPNTDLALILVAAVAAVGALGRRSAVLVAALSAAFWFDFFDTTPYDRLAIAKSPDVETTLVLIVVAVMAGELALWTARHRAAMRVESQELTSVRNAAELVASGEELVGVIDAVASELRRLLALESCTFDASGEATPSAEVDRRGHLVPTGAPALVGTHLVAALPVVVQGEELGRFMLELGEASMPTRDRLLVAITLADQVGAAFLAQAPPPLPPAGSGPIRGLRLVRSSSKGRAGGLAGADQETAGLSSPRDRMIS